MKKILNTIWVMGMLTLSFNNEREEGKKPASSRH